MFVRVDTEEAKKDIEGFSYKNSDGYLAHVKLLSCGIRITDVNDGDVSVCYTDDIPHLVKALQAAYNHQKGI